MINREKIIKWLEDTAGFFRLFQAIAPFRDKQVYREHEANCNDTIALLKEQGETIKKLYKILDDTCKEVREETEQDYVCGLCQYDGAYKTDSGDWVNECPGFDERDCFCMKNKIRAMCGVELLP